MKPANQEAALQNHGGIDIGRVTLAEDAFLCRFLFVLDINLSE